jgi:hypothetical protein
VSHFGTCSKCGHAGPKIPTDKIRGYAVVHVDERGYQWKFNRCPDCCSVNARKARELSKERAELAAHWDGLIKKSRELKSKGGRNDRTH